jgi:hypothetical protein
MMSKVDAQFLREVKSAAADVLGSDDYLFLAVEEVLNSRGVEYDRNDLSGALEEMLSGIVAGQFDCGGCGGVFEGKGPTCGGCSVEG